MRRPNGERASGQAQTERPALSRRFYTAATVAAVASDDAAEAAPAAAPADPRARPLRAQGWRVLIDGRGLRTPAKRELAVPTRALAAAIAAEWEAQRETIDPSSMPLTRLANSAIDGVVGRQAEVCADIVKYLASDLVCYRASNPLELVRREAEAWDPILDWSQGVLGLRLRVGAGVVPLAQPPAAGAALASWLAGLDAFALTAMHVMTSLLGSALLALAHARGHLAISAAWAAAHIDEDFQAEKWGVDELAKARRDRQWGELEAASRLFALSGEIDKTFTICR